MSHHPHKPGHPRVKHLDKNADSSLQMHSKTHLLVHSHKSSCYLQRGVRGSVASITWTLSCRFNTVSTIVSSVSATSKCPDVLS